MRESDGAFREEKWILTGVVEETRVAEELPGIVNFGVVAGGELVRCWRSEVPAIAPVGVGVLDCGCFDCGEEAVLALP